MLINDVGQDLEAQEKERLKILQWEGVRESKGPERLR